MATLDELLNGAQPPAPLPNVNPEGLTQAGSNMATMGGQPTPPANPQAQPPATPEEFNARKNGWMQMLETLRANPAAQQAMMFAASRLLNGPRFGQSQGGAIGEAAFGGMSMYNQLKENQSEQELKQREADRRDQLVGADIGLRQAQTGEVQQRTTESAAKMPIEMDKLRLDAKRANLELAIKEIETMVAQGIDVPTQIKQKLDKMRLELAAVQANINQSKASAANSYAAAGANRELAASRRDARPWETSKAASEATEAMHKANIAGVDSSDRAKGIPISGKSGTVPAKLQEMQFMREQIRMQNPGISEQELSAKFIENQASAKLNPQQADLKLIELWQAEQEMGTTTLTKEQYLEEGRALLRRKGTAAGPKGVPGAGQPTRWTMDEKGNPVRVKQ